MAPKQDLSQYAYAKYVLSDWIQRAEGLQLTAVPAPTRAPTHHPAPLHFAARHLAPFSPTRDDHLAAWYVDLLRSAPTRSRHMCKVLTRVAR